MNRRGKRIAFTVAAMGVVVVAVLVVANWGTVRDHVEAWHFQLTRVTQTIEEVGNSKGFFEVVITEVVYPAGTLNYSCAADGFLLLVGRGLREPVIVAVEISKMTSQGFG